MDATPTSARGTFATVPAPAGFTPLASALVRDSAQNVGGDSSHIEERSVRQPLVLGLNANNAALVADPPLFPQVVHCERVIRVFTTTTVDNTITGVFTTFVTAPTPSQSVPSIPAQVTTTTTTYTTSTVTVASMPTATLYAACQSDNLVSHVPGRRPIVQAANDYSITRERRHADSAYACCVSCQLENGCTGSLYYRGACFTFRPSTDTCGNPGDLRYGRRANFDGAFVASNGKCGSWRLSQTPPTTEWEDEPFVRK
ncbi:Cell surface glycoprotein 1 [Colletotrichum sp. SAR11_57]|nr:Cell surface glycoprotein 1 [Colletotrichum sp. SAR11_57]